MDTKSLQRKGLTVRDLSVEPRAKRRLSAVVREAYRSKHHDSNVSGSLFDVVQVSRFVGGGQSSVALGVA